MGSEKGKNSLPAEIALTCFHEPDRFKYVSCTKKDFYLQFGSPLTTTKAKFIVEPAKCGGGHVHIKSFYNGRYWQRDAQDDDHIKASATKPVEDRNNRECTLFLPKFSAAGPHVEALRHIQPNDEKLNYFVMWESDGSRDSSQVRLKSKQMGPKKFKAVDYAALVILPRYVSFVGTNDKYLGPYTWKDSNSKERDYLRFIHSDSHSSLTMNEVFYTPDGGVRIKNVKLDKYWQGQHGWIVVESPRGEEKDTIYLPKRIAENVICLQAPDSKNYLKRLSYDIHDDYLCASSKDVTWETRMRVVEPIFEKMIRVYSFHIEDSTILSTKPITLNTQSITNDTNVKVKKTLSFQRVETTTWNWNVSATLKLGAKANIQSGIPRVVEGKIEVSGEVSVGVTGGQNITTTTTTTSQVEVEVPPKTIMKVSLLANESSFIVPYSYTQIDKLVNGDVVTQDLDDGIFRGVNGYNFDYKVETIDLTKPTN